MCLSSSIREIVLQRVAVFVKKFVLAVSATRGLSEAMANAAGGKIFSFGSHGLAPGEDLDVLCVVPKHVSRDDFFTVLKGMLRKVKGVSGVVVSEALTCIMPGKSMCDRVCQMLLSPSSRQRYLGFH
jgi:poly(A) polymerase